MSPGPMVVESFELAGTSHVVWVPDSYLGQWDSALSKSSSIQLIRACREGEAIALAAGLILGGARPLVLMQCTGLFEAGDALRNIVHDLKLPLKMLVGVRSQRSAWAGKSNDNCPRFTVPILQAWTVPFEWVDPTEIDRLRQSLSKLMSDSEARALLVAE